MIEFNTPANTIEALAIIRAMNEGVTVANEGGAAHKPAEVMGIIGKGFLFYTSAYCAWAQRKDGLWQGMKFSNSIPFWLEDLASGKMIPVNKTIVGARQLLEAVRY